MPGNLWQFTYSRDANKYALPKLSPAGDISGDNFTFRNTAGSTTAVNIRDEYLWTHSKPRVYNAGREEVPYVKLTERRIKLNSYIAQMIYSAGAAGEGISDIIQGIGNATSNIGGQTGANAVEAAKKAFNLFKSALGKGVNTLGDTKIGSSFIAGTTEAVEKFKTATTDDDPSFLASAYLQPYKGLYITEKTGWQFLLPYFSNSYQTTSNQWGAGTETTGGSFFAGGLTELAQSAASLTRNILGTLETGAYVENSQFYQYAQTGDNITVKFPLINTGEATYDDVVKNWQFIFLLLYNNKPERVNKNLIEPPPLYELDIPGVRYMPFTFMSNISIDYKGARRTMKIRIPGNLQTSNNVSNKFVNDFETIIPEAYDITITLQGLVTDTKNFMIATFEDKPVRVYDIGSRIPPIDQRILERGTRILEQREALGNLDINNIA